MATKTEHEKNKETAIAPRTSQAMQFRLLTDESVALPEIMETMLQEGYKTQRHVKLSAGDYVKGIFRGMIDGELSERLNKTTGELTTPKVKWIFVEQSSGVIIRLLGGYNMVAQLERAKDGDAVAIARGTDYDIPGGFRCTDYMVMVKPSNPVPGAAGATVEVPSAKA